MFCLSPVSPNAITKLHNKILDFAKNLGLDTNLFLFSYFNPTSSTL